MSSLSGTTPELDPGALPRGVTPPSGAGGRFLSDVIVALGFADRETVDQALDGSRAPGKKLGTTLVEMGALSEQQLGRAVAERYRLDFLDLSEFDIDPEAIHVIGDAEMRRYEAVPVAFTEDGALVVAMIDPADWLAAEEMAQLTGRRIRRAVAAPSQVIELISRVAEARSRVEEGGVDGSGAGTSSAMPSRLTLRRVAKPLAGPAFGRAFGVAGRVPGETTPDGRSAQVPDEAPVAPVAFEPASPVAAPDEAVEGRVVPLTPRTSEGPESPVHEPVEAPAPDAEKAAEPDPALAAAAPDDQDQELEPSGGDSEPGVGPADRLPQPEEERDGEPPAEEFMVEQPLERVSVEPPTSARAVDGPAVEFPGAAPLSTAPVQTQHAAENELAPPPVAPDPPSPAQEVVAPLPSASTDGHSQQLEAVQAELADARAALDHGRDELEATRGELVSVRSRHDAALERTAEAERLLAESRTQIGRLEAELAASQEQSRSLREDLAWARGQIEQQGQREDEALTELRNHIEAMNGLRPVGPPPPPAPADPASSRAGETPPAPASGDQPAAGTSSPRPVASSSNGASASLDAVTAPSPASPQSSDHGQPAPAEPEAATGTTKARGLKRLIAAVRRL